MPRIHWLPSLITALAIATPASAQHSRVISFRGDSTFYPEGVTFSPTTGTYFLGSIRHGIIGVVKDGVMRELPLKNTARVSAIMGVRAAGNYLYATTSGLPQNANYQPGDSAIAALLRVRISDGVVERRWDLPAVPGGRVIGDLEVAPNGDVFFSDSKQPYLYWLHAASDSVETITNPLFRSLQGMALSDDGRVLYFADYPNGLLRLNLVSREVGKVLQEDGSPVRGLDGIRMYKNSIVAVYNGRAPNRVVRLWLTDDGLALKDGQVIDQNELATEASIGEIVGDEFVYVANSQWEEYDEAGKRNGKGVLKSPVLLAVTLK